METKDSTEISSPKEDTGQGDVLPYRQTQRGLASRHVQLMAIGGFDWNWIVCRHWVISA